MESEIDRLKKIIDNQKNMIVNYSKKMEALHNSVERADTKGEKIIPKKLLHFMSKLDAKFPNIFPRRD